MTDEHTTSGPSAIGSLTSEGGSANEQHDDREPADEGTGRPRRGQLIAPPEESSLAGEFPARPID